MKRAILSAVALLLFFSGQAVRASPELEIAESTFTLSVNYGLSVDSLVAKGNYDWKSVLINDVNFHTLRIGSREVVLTIFNFNLEMSSDEILRLLDAKGFRPAELHEILFFGISYPDAQRECAIGALGSVLRFGNGTRGFPVLWGDASERRLSLAGYEIGLGSDACFAAVRR